MWIAHEASRVGDYEESRLDGHAEQIVNALMLANALSAAITHHAGRGRRAKSPSRGGRCLKAIRCGHGGCEPRRSVHARGWNAPARFRRSLVVRQGPV